jgi:hypothetical protein
MKIMWNSRDWAEAIAALPAPGPLPCRTALVPRERVAHSLRREMLRVGHAAALAGTRFVPTSWTAVAVLQAAGVDFALGEERLRPSRLLALFRGDLALQHFSPALLRDKPGWDEAFARTIADLEAAALRPEDLEADATPRLADVAMIWRAADRPAGTSWTTERVYLEAARLLERNATRWPFPGAVLAVATGHASAAQARFLRAIPGAMLALRAARPIRERHVARVEALFGREAARALASAAAPRAATSERDLLASFLFEPPAVLAERDRPRSDGPDGTVRLEEHAGVEAEIEATADWVAEQVMDGVALEDIAVLVPSLDPLAGLVAERLGRLPWHDGALPVHVAGGLPLAGTAAGARALGVVRALRAHLDGGSLASILPALRPSDDEAHHLSHGAATDLVWSLGTAGGNPTYPEGALDWAARAARREADLAARSGRARAEADDDPERAALARTARDLERLLTDLRTVRPALDALVGVARLVVERAPLTALWPALREFLAGWLLQPGGGPRVHARLDERLAAVCHDATCGALAGDEALALVEDVVVSTRLPAARFGEAAVYVGTLAGAAGLRFDAVRVIGLAEGHVPPLPREDPVLPAGARDALGVPGAADAALRSLHALDTVVRDAGRHVALSAPRLDLDRSQREPSSVILEAAAALGRPDAVTGERARRVPDAAAFQRDAFTPARRAALDFRRRLPLAEAAWHDAVAAGTARVLARWRGDASLDLDRILTLLSTEYNALDGLLGITAVDILVPGLRPERPISPSSLRTLLECPHRFLLEKLLGFEEPSAAPTLREIGQPSYGSLLHLVAEDFYRAHGARFSAREGDVDRWLAVADDIVERRFEEFVEEYPVVGDLVRGRERERLREDIRRLLRYELGRSPRRFVDAERSFGDPVPVDLSIGGQHLYVRGKIDRVEVEGDHTLVSDLKTGRSQPRLGKAAGPDPGLDVQIAVYGLVAARLAAEWETPARVAAAYAYLGRAIDERAFRDDFDTLLAPAARQWLSLAAALLKERAFPRTPDPDDCTFCHLRPVCGDAVHDRAARVLAAGGGVLARFAGLKQGEEED